MTLTQPLDCVCVIHGDLYDFRYVENLYSMLNRNLDHPFRFTVFTESQRYVPDHMRKVVLDEWPGISGRRLAWWYKMQIFDTQHDLGQVLYLDLDTVIVNNLDWLLDLDTQWFWTLRDFRYLWNPTLYTMNSSLMYFDHKIFSETWQRFAQEGVDSIRSRHRGDQDYLQSTIPGPQKRFVDTTRVQSWRWQTWEGGINPRTKKSKKPGSGTNIGANTSLLVFHGRPNPHEVNCPIIARHWR